MSIFSEGDLDRLRDYYPERPGKLSHGLAGHKLLTLESLVELGKRLPRACVEYNAGDLPYGVDPEEVSHTGLSVEDTIRGIEECGSWMVLKHVDQDPAFEALLEEALGELAPVIEPVTGEMMTKVGFIFVSSPGAVTPFHLDPEHNVSCSRSAASKTMMIVPGDEERGPAREARGLSCRRPPQRALAGRIIEARGHKFELDAWRRRPRAADVAPLGEERAGAVDQLLDHLEVALDLSGGRRARYEPHAAQRRPPAQLARPLPAQQRRQGLCLPGDPQGEAGGGALSAPLSVIPAFAGMTALR